MKVKVDDLTTHTKVTSSLFRVKLSNFFMVSTRRICNTLSKIPQYNTLGKLAGLQKLNMIKDNVKLLKN